MTAHQLKAIARTIQALRQEAKKGLGDLNPFKKKKPKDDKPKDDGKKTNGA